MSLERLVARIRLCGGMLLMLYVICHLSNLSLGLWSLQLMEQWRHVIMVPWQSWIGQFLLYGSRATGAAPTETSRGIGMRESVLNCAAITDGVVV